MNYYVYKIKFLAPFHTGNGDGSASMLSTSMTLRADTIFSALCNEAARSFSIEEVLKIIDLCKDGKLLLSDTFPYCGDKLYLPKPIYPLSDNAVFDVENRKEIKSLSWLPCSKTGMEAFSEYIKTGYMQNASSMKTKFAVSSVYTKTTLSRNNDNTVPFRVSAYEFLKDCGLYGIIGCEDESDKELICRLFYLMSFGGIGGMTSRGYGRFSFELMTKRSEYTDYLLSKIGKKAENNLLLTTSLPEKDEINNVLDGAYYNIVRRGGFSFSPNTDIMVKKETGFFLSSGSVLKNTFKGNVYKVGRNGNHSIYRYSKPIFMEVTL